MTNERINCRCDECGQSFRVKAAYAGKRVRCPNPSCASPVVIPKAKSGKPKRSSTQPAAALPPRGQSAELPPSGARPAKKKPTSGRTSRNKAVFAIPLAAVLAVVGFVVSRGGDSPPEQQTAGPVNATTADLTASEQAASTAAHAAPAGLPPFSEAIAPFLESNCLDCHSGDEPEGDLNLAADHSADAIRTNRSRWEKAFDMIRIGAMPPPDYATPSDEETETVVAWLDETLFFVDCEATPDPGRVTMRRLNKTEYRNSVQDLFGIDFDPAKGFPSDEVGYGFDNIGDVLTVPPLLLEKYLDAAEQITSKVILTGNPDLAVASREVNRLKTTSGAFADKSAGHVVMAASGATTTFEGATVPRAAEYVVRIEAGGDQVGDEPVKLEVKVDGKKIGVVDVSAKKDQPQKVELKQTLSKGTKSISATFINDFYKKRIGDRNAAVYTIELVGPYGIDRSRLPATHTKLTESKPTKDKSVSEASAENLKPLLRRMFRRNVSDAEVGEFAHFAKVAVDRGESFDFGMKVAIQAALVSPKFLFRIEADEGATGTLARRLTPFELASRLSYFLWNTTPDDQLLDLAANRELLRTDVLEGEVKRLLNDPRADEMIDNFSGQWLGLRRIVEMSVDTEVYSSFNEKLRQDMATETRDFVRHVLRSGRPITELLSARYSFLNQRLAQHYGIDGVEGDKFRKVALPEKQRAGLLTQASVLLLTSYPNRTSPVKRGEWVLTNILGDEPPPAPPNVPTLEETQAAAADLTLREQMAKHREDPSCAACHKTMDAIGFGFENYDGIGKWRAKDRKHDVDASGTLPSGESFSGAVGLIDILSKREQDFVETFTERLLTFALGRGVEYTDQCVLDATIADAKAHGNSFASIVAAIVRSDAFRYQGSLLERLPKAVAASSQTATPEISQ